MMTFENLTTEGLDRVIAAYERGLEEHAAARVNYPCGSRARTVRRWLNRARAVRAARS